MALPFRPISHRRTRSARLRCAAAAVLGLCLLLAAPAGAAQSTKKSIWGPIGASQFPIYKDLGVGILQTDLSWLNTAPTRPANPTDPGDPAYRWPPELDVAIQEGQRHGIAIALKVQGTPPWANGARDHRWAPDDPADFANFMAAAARRYPAVRHWIIWGEPSRAKNFMPLTPERRDRRLNRRQRRAPQLYARLLDAAYGAIKAVDRRDLVIGGNTFTTGDISVLNWVRYMRLPNPRPPRMDLYGHNPFTARRPNLRKRPLGHGFADFSDLDTLARWLDRYQRRGRRKRLFLSEFTLPTDQPNQEFNFWVSRRTQASWLGSALRITKRWSRIYTLGWHTLYDDPPNATGDETRRGLIDHQGRRKPAYYVYRRH